MEFEAKVLDDQIQGLNSHCNIHGGCRRPHMLWKKLGYAPWQPLRITKALPKELYGEAYDAVLKWPSFVICRRGCSPRAWLIQSLAPSGHHSTDIRHHMAPLLSEDLFPVWGLLCILEINHYCHHWGWWTRDLAQHQFKVCWDHSAVITAANLMADWWATQWSF